MPTCLVSLVFLVSLVPNWCPCVLGVPYVFGVSDVHGVPSVMVFLVFLVSSVFLVSEVSMVSLVSLTFIHLMQIPKHSTLSYKQSQQHCWTMSTDITNEPKVQYEYIIHTHQQYTSSLDRLYYYQILYVATLPKFIDFRWQNTWKYWNILRRSKINIKTVVMKHFQ